MTLFDWLSLTPRRFKSVVALGIAVLFIGFPNTGRALFMKAIDEVAAQKTSELRQGLAPMLARARYRELLSRWAGHQR